MYNSLFTKGTEDMVRVKVQTHVVVSTCDISYIH
jgi:hypothetical protein